MLFVFYFTRFKWLVQTITTAQKGKAPPPGTYSVFSRNVFSGYYVYLN